MKKHLLQMLLLFIFSSVFAQKPFEFRGWQIHEADIAKVEDAINKAPEYGINFIIFSHALYRHTAAFLISDENFDKEKAMEDPYIACMFKTDKSSHAQPSNHFQKDIKYLGNLCKQKGIDYYLWTHELDNIPSEFINNKRVDMNNPKLYDYLKNRYNKLFDILPDASGIVLTLHETEYRVFRDKEVISDIPIPDRMYKIAKLLYDVVKQRGKTLIIRNFLYEPGELSAFKEMIAKLPDDVVIMDKPVPHEFQPFYPPDPMHGDVGKKRQIIELDLGTEMALGKDGIFVQTEYIKRNINRAYNKGLAGAVGRCRLYYDNSFKNFHEVNLYAYSSFIKNPDQTIDEVLTDWAKKRFDYAPKAVPYIVSAFKRTQFINFNGRYHLEYWLTKSIGENWDSYNYYFSHLFMRARSKWTNNPADSLLEYRFYYPDEEIFNQLLAEKREVVSECEAVSCDLKIAEKWLNIYDKKLMNNDIAFLKDATSLIEQWVTAYFAQRIYINTQNEKYKKITLNALESMVKIEKTPDVSFGLDTSSGRRYNIDKFVETMTQRLNNRDSAIIKDKELLNKIGYTFLLNTK